MVNLGVLFFFLTPAQLVEGHTRARHKAPGLNPGPKEDKALRPDSMSAGAKARDVNLGVYLEVPRHIFGFLESYSRISNRNAFSLQNISLSEVNDANRW